MVKEKGAADGSLFTTFKRQIANTHLVVSDKDSRIKTSSRVSIISENPETDVIPKSKIGKFISRFVSQFEPPPNQPPSETLLSETFVGFDTAISPVYLNAPSGVAYDSSDNLYIADSDNNIIRAVNLSSTNVTVFKKTIAPGNIDTVVGYNINPVAGMNALRAVDIDNLGNLYLSDQVGRTLRRVDAITNDITIVSGKYSISSGANTRTPSTVVQQPNNVPASQGLWDSIRGVTFDSRNNIYCVDSGNEGANLVRKIY